MIWASRLGRRWRQANEPTVPVVVPLLLLCSKREGFSLFLFFVAALARRVQGPYLRGSPALLHFLSGRRLRTIFPLSLIGYVVVDCGGWLLSIAIMESQFEAVWETANAEARAIHGGTAPVPSAQTESPPKKRGDFSRF